ncbi:hypothetical protein WJX72_001203 [[Myrmecia] bisecta]|uniref:MYND-type domain-containing protein n=1 Tax=[Myrmecia] bisecta TaxID=41462 RepID=A0AAW1PWV0_9CHLO
MRLNPVLMAEYDLPARTLLEFLHLTAILHSSAPLSVRRDHVEQLIELCPQSAGAWYYRYVTMFQANDFKGAFDALCKAVDLAALNDDETMGSRACWPAVELIIGSATGPTFRKKDVDRLRQQALRYDAVLNKYGAWASVHHEGKHAHLAQAHYDQYVAGHPKNAIIKGPNFAAQQQSLMSAGRPPGNSPAALLHCAKCDTMLHKVLKCNRCKQAGYCSKECQCADWGQHKKACKLVSGDS